MIYKTKSYKDVRIRISKFKPFETATERIQTVFHFTDSLSTLKQQCIAFVDAFNNLIDGEEYKNDFPVFARCFMSDADNQQEIIEDYLNKTLQCAISYVCQPPLDGGKFAIWLEMQSEGIRGNDGLFYYEHNGYRHYRTVEASVAEDNSFGQTWQLLEDLEMQLHRRGCILRDNCVRTWFFVRDIDMHYSGVVEARKEFFLKHDLTPETHYIASTGIGGNGMKPYTKVLLDSHCIKGIDSKQIKYLYAKNYLNSTYEYGVTFERGMYMDYGDRRQVYISGTASIDNRGYVLHLGDVVAQSKRACENVEALLQEADCSMQDISLMIIYLRDVTDYPRMREYFNRLFPGVPKQMVLAPVCRSGWLIEIECMAEIAIADRSYPNY